MGRPRKVVASPFADQSAPAGADGIIGPHAGGIDVGNEAAIALSRVPLTPEAQAAQAERRAAVEAEQAADPVQHIERNRTRIPFGTHRQRLISMPRPGFKRRYFNDVGDRIARALDAGYAHVMDPRTKKPVQTTAGSRDGGGSLIAYLMEIPEQFYSEDFAAKQERLNEVDQQIYTGKHNEEQGDNRYVPRSGINVRVERGMGR